MESLSIAVKSILAFTIVIDAFLILLISTGKQTGMLRTLFLIHLLGIIGWAISILIVLQSEDLFAARLSFVSALIFAAAKYYFVLAFPENKLPKRIWHYIPLACAAIGIILASIPGMVFNTADVVDGYYITVDVGPFSALYSIIVSFLLIYPIFALLYKFFKGSYTDHTKQQLKYLSIGTALFFIISLSTNSILPVFFDIYFFNGLGPAFSLILATFIFIIISRHHFLGLRLIIQRSFIFSLLFFFIACVYISIITVSGFFLQQITETAIIINAGITTLIGIFTVPYIDRYLRKKTDAFFFKDTYNYADALHGLSEKINRSVLIDDIKSLTAKSLCDILKASSVVIDFVSKQEIPKVLQETNGHHNRTTLLIPIMFDRVIIGTIFLGEKKSGDDYTREDVVLIQTFSYQIALAFEKARLFNEVQEHALLLEEKVAERTQQLRAVQEQQNQMMLDISHRLQTPLTIVKSELRLLQQKMPQNKEFLFFEKTIDDISLFIYDLLRLARLGVHTTNEETAPLNLSDHMHELLEYFATLAQQQNVILKSDLSTNVVFVSQKKDMTELLTNLLSNALKYIHDGKNSAKEIDVTLSQTAENILITIADTGCGISEHELPHIFERFYRASPASAIKGTGLGLAICKKIVETYGGTIRAESVLDEGTKFIIRLPR